MGSGTLIRMLLISLRMCACLSDRPFYGAYGGVVLNSSVIGGKNLGVVLCFFGLVSRMFDVKKYVYNA